MEIDLSQPFSYDYRKHSYSFLEHIKNLKSRGEIQKTTKECMNIEFYHNSYEILFDFCFVYCYSRKFVSYDFFNIQCKNHSLKNVDSFIRFLKFEYMMDIECMLEDKKLMHLLKN
jgi:hypothetical protein